MNKSIDEQARKKYNRKLLKDGFKSAFKEKIKNLYQSEDKNLTFPQFLLKHAMWLLCGLVPVAIDFIKDRTFDLYSLLGAVGGVLLLSFLCWSASKLGLKKD